MGNRAGIRGGRGVGFPGEEILDVPWIFRDKGPDQGEPVHPFKGTGQKLSVEAGSKRALFFPDPTLEGAGGRFLRGATADDGQGVAVEGLVMAESTVREPGFPAEVAEGVRLIYFRHVVVGAPTSLPLAGSSGVAC